MKLARREVLALASASAAAAWLTGCESIEQALTHPQLADRPLPARPVPAELHLLNRITFGPRPGDLAEVERIGLTAYVDRELSPNSIAEPGVLTLRLGAVADMLGGDTGLLFDEDDRRVVGALRQATTLRALYSRRQLYERLVEFWSDHFNIYAFKGQGPQLKVVDDHDTIRTHALGRFEDLLLASARSAAMLGYLDNTANRRGVPNENYAREVMELHTLGVHGGYTQRDVRELARCLTGWTAEQHWHRGRFRFDAAVHDTGAKDVLGLSIPPGGGVDDGVRALTMLAAHPSTARHLAAKLCRYFLGDTPPSLVLTVAGVFLRTSGDIRSMVRAIVLSSEFMAAGPIFKRPFDYAVSALRALNADSDAGAGVQDQLLRMGQPLFGWPMPNGYPIDPESWTGALIPRWNFALSLTAGAIENTHIDIDALLAAGRRVGLAPAPALAEFVLGAPSSDPRVRAVLDRVDGALSDPRLCAALLLMSPEFQWR
ncbi:MAG: DUF1800 domain-containing protein [Capsulimonadaceae bacterium]